MNSYRMYIKDDRHGIYTMAMIQANSFKDAIEIVEPNLRDTQYLVSVLRYSDTELPIDDPFLAGILLEEISDALEHLVKTGYDTSQITSILSAYSGDEVEGFH